MHVAQCHHPAELSFHSKWPNDVTAGRADMALLFVEQMSQSLTMETAMAAHLPCYCDLRHEGGADQQAGERTFC
eukprot:SAG22_NODE_709_length_7742_cov_2.383488_4_plen_74_part_00